MYFKDFPQFLYDFKYGNTNETKMSIVTDITRNIRFRKEILSSIATYDLYDIVDGETPEIIAEKVYGNPNYHWIIMLANERYDWITDFPLEYQSLMAHAADKYNPTMYSSAGNWEISGGKIWFSVDNQKDAFDPRYLTTSVTFKVSGATSAGTFNITKIWGTSDSGIDYATQKFWIKTTVTGTPTGTLTITTKDREHNPVYWLDSNGFKVSPDAPGAVSVSGLQEEERINESKRRIKIISPSLISLVLKQFKESL